MTNALELKNVCKQRGSFTLSDIDLTLPGGCIMGLIGENGAGKTTIIQLILNMIDKDSGTITILGQDNQQIPCSVKEKIGTVLNEPGISGCLTSLQAGKIMRGIFKNWDDDYYCQLLHELNIPTDKIYKNFSQGMKMKLGLAIALAHHPQLLLLDEATNGLDPVARDWVSEMLMEFTRSEENAVLFSSHIVSDLEKTCDYIAILHEGKLLLSEEKDLLLTDYSMVNCTEEDLNQLQPGAVVGQRHSRYGVKAVIRTEDVPASCQSAPVDLEELFVFMVKEDK